MSLAGSMLVGSAVRSILNLMYLNLDTILNSDRGGMLGLFDDMTVLLGKGMDAADKKSQALKLQSELDRIIASKESVLADLGREVLAREGANPSFVSTHADKIKAIGDFEAQERELRSRIEALQGGGALVSDAAMHAASAVVQGNACPACGNPVALESMYCSRCGDNLAALKARFRMCPRCAVYYPASATFCEGCGGKTVRLQVAAAVNGPAAKE